MATEEGHGGGWEPLVGTADTDTAGRWLEEPGGEARRRVAERRRDDPAAPGSAATATRSGQAGQARLVCLPAKLLLVGRGDRVPEGGRGGRYHLLVTSSWGVAGRSNALARRTAGSRGSSGRTASRGRSRGFFGRWMRMRFMPAPPVGVLSIAPGRWHGPVLWGDRAAGRCRCRRWALMFVIGGAGRASGRPLAVPVLTCAARATAGGRFGGPGCWTDDKRHRQEGTAASVEAGRRRGRLGAWHPPRRATADGLLVAKGPGRCGTTTAGPVAGRGTSHYDGRAGSAHVGTSMLARRAPIVDGDQGAGAPTIQPVHQGRHRGRGGVRHRASLAQPVPHHHGAHRPGSRRLRGGCDRVLPAGAGLVGAVGHPCCP